MGVRRITFGSSGCIYDGLARSTCSTRTRRWSLSAPYSDSKYEAEQRAADGRERARGRAAAAGHRRRLQPAHALRPRRQHVPEGRAAQEAPLLHDGGFMCRPLVDVLDVATAHIVCLDAPADKVAGQLFNVVQDNYQIKELAETVADAASAASSAISSSRRCRRPAATATTALEREAHRGDRLDAAAHRARLSAERARPHRRDRPPGADAPALLQPPLDAAPHRSPRAAQAVLRVF